MEKLKVIVTGVNKYDFKDRDTGKQIQGCSVHFIDLNPNGSEYSAGYFPNKANVEYMMFDRLSKLELPYLCEAELSLNLSNKSRPWKIVSFDPVEKLEVLNESLMRL